MREGQRLSQGHTVSGRVRFQPRPGAGGPGDCGKGCGGDVQAALGNSQTELRTYVAAN